MYFVINLGHSYNEFLFWGFPNVTVETFCTNGTKLLWNV